MRRRRASDSSQIEAVLLLGWTPMRPGGSQELLIQEKPDTARLIAQQASGVTKPGVSFKNVSSSSAEAKLRGRVPCACRNALRSTRLSPTDRDEIIVPLFIVTDEEVFGLILRMRQLRSRILPYYKLPHAPCIRMRCRFHAKTRRSLLSSYCSRSFSPILTGLCRVRKRNPPGGAGRVGWVIWLFAPWRRRW